MRGCGRCSGSIAWIATAATQAEARVDLEAMADGPDFGRGFKDWEKVVRVLRERKMPPKAVPQPSDPQREAVVRAVEAGLRRFIEEHQGDPGPVAIRRLTSAEYAYTIRDLTGLDLKVADDFVSDAVSGEGFTNAGDAQFMQDSTLERYLQAAKVVADHAVIGAGPLGFFADPGKTGRELSAIARIQAIYREHGFRTAAGEGAEPFGLDRYPRAMFVAWQYPLPRPARPRGGDAAGARPARGRERPALRAPLGRPQPGRCALPALGDRRAVGGRCPRPGELTEAEARGRCDELGRVLRGVAEDARRGRRRRGGGRRADGGRGPGRGQAHP